MTTSLARATLVAYAVVGVCAAGVLGGGRQAARSTIAFVSTRHDSTPVVPGDPQRSLLAAEIYLMNGDGTEPRRLTENNDYDGFPSMSPDGKRIVFDSNRRRSATDPFNTSDLFVMNVDGTGQTWVARGSSATWSPDGKHIAFHASASGTGQPIKPDPGAATSDNDIFVVNVDDAITKGTRPTNITNNPAAIDDDADWSPDGRTILFTSHPVTDNPVNSPGAEIYAVAANGRGVAVRLTNNAEEERAPAWSPDGQRIVFCCRRGGPDFELCLMNRDGTGQVQLTDNDVPELTPTWSPDGRRIAFHRRVGGRGQFQIFVMNADGSGEIQLTSPPGVSAFPHWSK